MKKNSIILFLLLTILISCNTQTNNQVEKSALDSLNLSESEHLVMSVVWYQKSAEMRAIYYQTFNFGKKLLAEKIADNKDNSVKYAIIVDVDETMLDNSPFEAQLIKDGKFFNKDLWKEWVELAQATALPGAVEFAKYAEEMGVEIFYVSNRNNDMVQATVTNMQAVGFPFADVEHCLFRTESSDKTERRATIAENYEIILLIGDNLRDFDELFKQREGDLGFSVVDENKDLLGDKFLILPNPMYGEWEKAAYGGGYPETEIEKSKLRKEIIEGY